jgi:hypothetical protein
MTENQPEPQQPAHPERPLTASEKKAQVERDNAFRDLSIAMGNLAQAPLSVAHIDMVPGGKIVVHASPGEISNLLMQLNLKLSQVQICAEVLTNMYLQRHPEEIKPFMELTAKAAEATASMMNRALLSQGAPQKPGLIRPQ